MIQLLLISDAPKESSETARLLELLESAHPACTVATSSLAEMPDHLAHHGNPLILVLLLERPPSREKLSPLLTINAAIVVLGRHIDLVPRELFASSREPADFLELADTAERLPSLIRSLVDRALTAPSKTPDADFVRIDPRTLSNSVPLRTHLYIKLGPDRYVKLMNKDDFFTEQDASRYLVEREIDSFYLLKAQSHELLKRQEEKLDEALSSTSLKPEKARELAEDSLELIVNISKQIGFTPAAQEIANKTVQLTLHAIGKDPKLTDILVKLAGHKGRYITSHSLMLAEVACALAHSAGWDSSSTFLKLTLAALLHDLSLFENYLAQISDLRWDHSLLTKDEQVEIRLHPIKSAQFAATFHRLPPDVDRIVAQHHERPDGSGFPRGDAHQKIHPLSALFIIAQDMLAYFLLYPSQATLANYLKTNEAKFTVGNFKTIFQACAATHRDT